MPFVVVWVFPCSSCTLRIILTSCRFRVCRIWKVTGFFPSSRLGSILCNITRCSLVLCRVVILAFSLFSIVTSSHGVIIPQDVTNALVVKVFHPHEVPSAFGSFLDAEETNLLFGIPSPTRGPVGVVPPLLRQSYPFLVYLLSECLLVKKEDV